jgi:Ca2+-binding RTX toxin-like protein
VRTTPDVEAPQALDAVVVRSRNRIERLQDVPLSVSVVTGQELDSLAANDISEIVQRVGNISWNNTICARCDNRTLVSSGTDTLHGSREGDFLQGGARSDTVFGGAGDDVILGDGDIRQATRMVAIQGSSQTAFWQEKYSHDGLYQTLNVPVNYLQPVLRGTLGATARILC